MGFECFLAFLASRNSLMRINTITNAFKRQAGGGFTNDATALPVGAIIAIAIIGSGLLFGILTTTIMQHLRSRHRRKRGTQDLDPSDDSNEDIPDVLRFIRPPDVGLESRMLQKPYYAATGSPATDWPAPRFYGPQLNNPETMPPAYAFQITGLRDSWPMFGWVQSKHNMSQSVYKHPLINPENANKRTSYSAYIYSADNESSWPQPTLSRPGSFSGQIDRRSNRWSTHSAKSSVPSFKRLSANQKSVSDNQLTSILRSTSQRLKTAQRRPVSQSMNVLRELRPRSPSRDQDREVSMLPVDNDSVPVVDSVPSPVLHKASQTLDPQNFIVKTAEPVQESGKKTPPVTSDLLEVDSLCPSKTPDLYIPAALSSPSKREVQAGPSYKMSASPGNDPVIKISRDNGNLPVPLADSSGNAGPSPGSISFGNNSFLHVETETMRRFSHKSPKGPRPMIKRNAAAQRNLKTDGNRDLSSPLRIMAGNPRLPNQLNLGLAVSPTETYDNPFHWLAQSSKPSGLYPSQKATGKKKRGHKRNSAVRLSDLSRPASARIVPGNFEKGLTQAHADALTEVPVDTIEKYQFSPEREPSCSMVRNNNSLPDIRPPSISIFQPTLASLSTRMPGENTIFSEGFFSDAKSFSDPYSSSRSPLQFHYIDKPELSESPTLSTKKARRKDRDFSVDFTEAKYNTLLESNTSTFPSERPLAYLESASANFSPSDTCNEPPAAPVFISHVREPSSPPPLDSNGSITASIYLLRRMNSELSTHSAVSVSSGQSKESPTIPTLRGGGINPSTKKSNYGTSKYLDIGLKVPSPQTKRRRRRDTIMVEKARENHTTPAFHDTLETSHALGLEVPTLTHPSLPEEPPITVYNSSPASKAPWRKAPTAQLRPRPTPFAVPEIPGEAGESSDEERTGNSAWFDAMSTPRKTRGPRWEGHLQLQAISPAESMYDERGFLKSSPERGAA